MANREYCPNCGSEIPAPGGASPAFCPSCGRLIILDDEPALTEPASEPCRDDELEELKIRKIASERRAAYRQRGYLLAGAGLCAIGAAQLAWNCGKALRLVGWDRLMPARFAALTLLVWIGWRLWQRAAAVTKT